MSDFWARFRKALTFGASASAALGTWSPSKAAIVSLGADNGGKFNPLTLELPNRFGSDLNYARHSSHSSHRSHSSHYSSSGGSYTAPATPSYSPPAYTPPSAVPPASSSLTPGPGRSDASKGSGVSSAAIPPTDPSKSIKSTASAPQKDAMIMAMRVQLALLQRGYYSGAVDGKLGSGTTKALRDFQRDQGLAQTGKMDGSTLSRLGISG